MTTIPAVDFINYLKRLADNDRGALAVLRRSASFAPGTYPPAFPYVERFVEEEEHPQGRRRLARYLVSMLFALHPEHSAGISLAAAFGRLTRARGNASLEKRFVALLAAEPDELPVHLRNVVALLAADRIACDYAALEVDLTQWLRPCAEQLRDGVRQQWARDFYRVPEAARRHTASTSTNPSQKA